MKPTLSFSRTIIQFTRAKVNNKLADTCFFYPVQFLLDNSLEPVNLQTDNHGRKDCLMSTAQHSVSFIEVKLQVQVNHIPAKYIHEAT